ncbi:MAG: diguanylate cyclase [Lachnospiraceae bacterium]|nr:diguanylate cyclase [Lachnospiraceae bacterium]
MENTFKDYYKLLQVHYDASSEMIALAYDNLLKSRENASPERQALLKEAYEVLSDTTRRTIYHREWLNTFSERAQFLQESPRPYHTQPGDKNASAESVLDDFFHALNVKDWKNAYLRLSDVDQTVISYDEFCEWRTAINSCYEMQEYKLEYIKTHPSITLNTLTYSKVAEFMVVITDLDQNTTEISTDTLRKYVTFENDVWKVCLGINNLRPLINQYRQLALQHKKQQNEGSTYTAGHFDALTGLLSESGFYAEAGREVARNHRYHNPFSLLSFQIHCSDKAHPDTCLKHLAKVIQSACRSTDLAARLNNNQIICLLIETKLENAEAAAQKFLQIVTERAGDNYSVSFGLVFYNGYASLSDAVHSCCQMAGLPSHY